MALKLTDNSPLDLPDNNQAGFIADLVRNKGKVEDGSEVEWDSFVDMMTKDAVATPDIKQVLATATDVVIREPLEPLMIINSLYDRVQARGLQTQVLAGALGTVTADDIPERGPYPEVMFQIGGAMKTAYIGKAGLAAAFTEEALRYSTWDIWNMNLRQMRNALVRHKETKAVSFLKTLGKSLFDNADPAASVFGVLTGRDEGLAANGTLSLDDLLRAMAHMGDEGFWPDTLLVNPMMYLLGINDPVLRTMYLQHGGGQFFNQWSGVAGPRDPWSNGTMAGRGPSPGNQITPGSTGIAGREHGMTAAAPVNQSYFPWAFRVIVSPFVPFDPITETGDAFLLKSGDVGFYLEDEGVTEVSWRDEHVDVLKVKLRERYGHAVKYEGQGVGVLHNVKMGYNFWNGTVQAVNDSLAPIAPDANIDLG